MNLYALVISVLLLLLYIILNLLKKANNKLINLEAEYKDKIIKERQNAIKQSKSVIRGKVSEEFIPLFPDFPYNLSDCKFSGQPIDYIIFNGMSNLRDSNTGEIEIIFADVKVNTSSKSKVQLGIEKAIKEGRIKFETWNIIDNKIKIK